MVALGYGEGWAYFAAGEAADRDDHVEMERLDKGGYMRGVYVWVVIVVMVPSLLLIRLGKDCTVPRAREYT